MQYKYTHRPGMVSIWLEDWEDGERPDLDAYLGPTDPQSNGIASDGYVPNEGLYFIFSGMGYSESYYPALLRQAKKMNKLTSRSAFVYLDQENTVDKPGPLSDFPNVTFMGNYAYSQSALKIGDRLKEAENTVAIWISHKEDTASADEYLGWYDEDFVETIRGTNTEEFERELAQCSHGKIFAPKAMAAFTSLKQPAMTSAFLYYDHYYDQLSGKIPYVSDISFLGNFPI
jgi:hypothetical protein